MLLWNTLAIIKYSLFFYVYAKSLTVVKLHCEHVYFLFFLFYLHLTLKAKNEVFVFVFLRHKNEDL